MTFSQLVWKMMCFHWKKYQIYFWSQVTGAIVFMCFANILFHEDFMNPAVVDSLISSNIYFPGVLSAFLLVFLILLSAKVYLRGRMREYGILMVTGCSRNKIMQLLCMEQLILSVLGLLTSFVLGSAVSVLFYVMIGKITGIEKLHWKFLPAVFMILTVLYLISFFISLIINLSSVLAMQVIGLMKKPFHLHKKSLFHTWMEKHFPRFMRRQLPRKAYLAGHKWEWRLRWGISAILTAVAVWILCLGVALCPVTMRNAEMYAPYDMVFCEFMGMNQGQAGQVTEILRENGIAVTEHIAISYVRDNAFTYLPASEANKLPGCFYKIQQGTFRQVFPYDKGDGYDREPMEIEEIFLHSDRMKQEEKLISQGTEWNILYNRNPAFADQIVIVNDEDFRHMRQNSGAYWEGKANLFQFSSWESSGQALEDAQEYLNSQNGLPGEEWRYFRLTSRLEEQKKATASNGFMMTVFSFTAVVLLLSGFLVVFFGLECEQEEQERTAKSMYLTGVTRQQIVRYWKYRLRVRVLVPAVSGIILGITAVVIMTNSIF
ncbi:MAG: ABC transporter permease [Lachnospiraceae bacterium]|nr:ABC transporter permease [Lachnospiraceae bacterium]